MARLCILKRQSEQDACSEESRYLLSLCLLEARRVYDRVDLLLADEATTLDAANDGADLLLAGEANVFVGHRSLALMRQRLSEGYEAVWPYRLADSGLAATHPLYTLRGYERLEDLFLSSAPRPARAPDSHLPLSLLAATPGRALADRHGVRSLLSEPRLLAAQDLGARLAYEGLYHECADYYGQERADVLPFVPPSAREVLEIGCGIGATGAYLQERLGCRVTGVELNPFAARRARERLHRVVAGDVMDVELPGRYDAVLALELFEHLARPEEFLARIRPAVEPGGRIVLSVPNVGHYSIVADLVAGRWDYLPIGLLCYTHLRFFTRRTLVDWLRRCGFEKFEIVAQTTELSEPFASLAGAMDCDRESLRTKGFYVVVDV
jgi:SAM-dependent methyltransferase